MTLEQDGMDQDAANEVVVQHDVAEQQVTVQSAIIQEEADVQQMDIDPEEMLKAYYTTHSNTLGDSWFIW